MLFSDWLEHLGGQNRMSPVVDVFFGVRGTSVSADHAYVLYGAVARAWKRATMLGSINRTKSDYISFVAPMIRVDCSCSARARASD